MFTSCGWFFDDAAGIEPVQILQYAAIAIEKNKEAFGVDLEEAFVEKILKMKSLNPDYPTGFEIWTGLVVKK